MDLKAKADNIKTAPGKPIPLGTTVNKTGVNFCVQIETIGKLKLIIYKKGTQEILRCLDFTENMRYGRVYAMNVTGFDIRRFDYGYELNGKPLKDVYAKIINRSGSFGDTNVSYTYSVYTDTFNWDNDKNPAYDFSDMIIYRLHTRGFTMHKSSKVKNKGTFKGITEKIPYFKKMGITTVELMPAYEFEERFSREEDSSENIKNGVNVYNRTANRAADKLNFFGYGKAHFFAPKSTFAVKGGNSAVNEFKEMVKALHANGIELIMEFYFPKKTNPQLVTDCIRYWVMEYHIDGVKVNLDIANVDMLKSDPILWDTKIIGDRWDIIVGCDEYNPRYGEKRHIGVCHEGFMVTARRFIKSDEDQVYNMVTRMKDNNEAGAIINYLGNHNSFTLMDTVSFERKHNEANGEGNSDGSDYNYSWNCGVEGATKKRKIIELRKKQIKNAIALLFLSQGTPMIFSGDEMGQTRMGNNNPYCQDNDLSYINWNKTKPGAEIFDFVIKMIQYRKAHKILHMEKEMKMVDYRSVGYPDLSLHGTLPWRIDYNHVNRTFAMLYNEKYTGTDGGMIFIACNMYWENQEFNIPLGDRLYTWKIDIVTENVLNEEVKIINNRTLVVPPRSIVVLSLEKVTPVKQKK